MAKGRGAVAVAILLIDSLAISSAARISSHLGESARENVADTVDTDANSTVGVAVAGQVLRGRYVLKELLERRESQYPGHYGGRYPVGYNPPRSTRSGPGGKPGETFPTITRRALANPSHLGTGSFGDVWKAYDSEAKQEVAVKIFYTKRGGQPKFLTWTNADPSERMEFDTAQKECSLNKQILSHKDQYPVGASRICECFGEHISDAEGSDKAVFLVMEMCGKSLGAFFTDPLKSRRATDVIGARALTKQLLEALDFMAVFDPPLIHHDLKPDNVAVTDKGELKLIDWGGLVFGERSNMYKPAVGTPLYTPPEADNGRCAFQMPATSYDTYAVGLMYMEMLCPSMDYNEWFYYRPLSAATVAQMIGRKCPGLTSSQIGDDLALMGSLINRDPARRPSPSEALETAPFGSEEELPFVSPTTSGFFKVGDSVEYRSSQGAWLAGVIARVNIRTGTYDINHPNGQTMKPAANPARIRKLQRSDNHVSVDDAYRVPVRENRHGDFLTGNNVMQPHEPGSEEQFSNLPISSDILIFTPRVYRIQDGSITVISKALALWGMGVDWNFDKCVLKCGEREADMTMTYTASNSRDCSGTITPGALRKCHIYAVATKKSSATTQQVSSPELPFYF